MALDPNLDFQLAQTFVGGIELPSPTDANAAVFVNATGTNLEYRPASAGNPLLPLNAIVLVDSTASALQAALALGVQGTEIAPRLVALRGTFSFNQILVLPSWTYVDANYCRLTTTLAPAVGQADVPTNCLISQVATVGGYASTLTANFTPGGSQITVATTTGLAANGWVKITSNNGNNKPLNYLIDDGVTASKIYKIKSVDSGTLLTVFGYCRYWQKTTSTIVSITPHQGITWNGGSIDCSGGTIACAMYLDAAAGTTIKNATFKGFSRYAIEGVSTLKADVLDCSHNGEINGFSWFRQGDQTNVKGLRGPTTATAVKHANGVTRHLVAINERCCDTHVEDCEFSWATGGLYWLASDRTRIENCWSHDLDGSLLSRVVGGRGISFDGAHWNPAVEGMGNGLVIRDFRAANNKDGNGHANGQCEFYLHDVSDGQFSGLHYVNHGDSSYAHDVVVAADCLSSKLYDIVNTGGKVALKLEGYGIAEVRGIEQQGATGTGGSGFATVYADTPATSRVKLYSIRTANTGVVTFGPSFADFEMEVFDSQIDGGTLRVNRAIPVANPSATNPVRGAIWRFTGVSNASGIPEIALDAGGPGRKCRILNNSPFVSGAIGLAEPDPLGWAEERSPKFLPSAKLWLEAKTSQLSLTGKAVDFWFDEAGTVGDDAVGVSGPVYSSNNGGRPAIALNGSSQYFTIPDSADLTSTALTIVARIKRGVAGVAHELCFQYPGAGPWRFYVTLTAANKIYSEWNNIGTAECVYTGGTAWTDVAIVYDPTLAAASRVMHYINGVAQTMTNAALPASLGDPATTFYIGADDAVTRPFNGSFRFFGLFGVALTAAQVASITAYPGA